MNTMERANEKQLSVDDFQPICITFGSYKIACHSEEESARVLDRLFKAGCTWHNGEKTARKSFYKNTYYFIDNGKIDTAESPRYYEMQPNKEIKEDEIGM